MPQGHYSQKNSRSLSFVACLSVADLAKPPVLVFSTLLHSDSVPCLLPSYEPHACLIQAHWACAAAPTLAVFNYVPNRRFTVPNAAPLCFRSAGNTAAALAKPSRHPKHRARFQKCGRVIEALGSTRKANPGGGCCGILTQKHPWAQPAPGCTAHLDPLLLEIQG